MNRIDSSFFVIDILLNVPDLSIVFECFELRSALQYTCGFNKKEPNKTTGNFPTDSFSIMLKVST